MNFYFELVDDVVELQARLEDGDVVGDTRTELRAGEDFYGVSFDELRKAGSGVVEVGENGDGKIIDDEQESST